MTTIEATVCPNPTKSRFATREAAESAAVRNRLSVGKTLYPYQCDATCGWWHLTSKPRIATTANDVAEVRALTSEQFRQLVILDAQYQAPLSRALALREPSLVHRWTATITEINRDLAEQIHEHQGHDNASRDCRRSITQLQQNLGARRREAAEIVRGFRGAPGSSVNHREAPLRAAAGEVAIERLIAAHKAEFTAYLVEEYKRVGATIPDRIRRYQTEHGIPDPEPPS